MNENIALVDNNNIISSDIEIAKKPNAFFGNIVKELNIKVKYKKYKIQMQKYPKYKNYPGIQMTIIKHFHLPLFHLTPFLSKSYP